MKSITREDVAGFIRLHHAVPGNGALVIVGDVRPDAITAALEARLAAWPPGPDPDSCLARAGTVRTAGRAAGLPHRRRPGAPQSILAIGRIGASRKSPDFSAMIVMNAILGGQFASRININLRQEKGYSYGAESGFAFYRGPRTPSSRERPVESGVTKGGGSRKIFKELAGIAGARPVTDDELSFAKERIIQGFPGRFETTFGVAGQVAILVADELPDDEFERDTQPRIEALTRGDIDRVAKTYITPDRMTVLIVGDRATIERPLESLPWVKRVKHLDPEGHFLDMPISSPGVGERRRRFEENGDRDPCLNSFDPEQGGQYAPNNHGEFRHSYRRYCIRHVGADGHGLTCPRGLGFFSIILADPSRWPMINATIPRPGPRQGHGSGHYRQCRSSLRVSRPGTPSGRPQLKTRSSSAPNAIAR